MVEDGVISSMYITIKIQKDAKKSGVRELKKAVLDILEGYHDVATGDVEISEQLTIQQKTKREVNLPNEFNEKIYLEHLQYHMDNVDEDDECLLCPKYPIPDWVYARDY